MEVKPGYKQAEVGVIPEDWDVAFVEDIAHITTGAKNTQDRVEDGEYPFFVRSQTVERINSYSFDGEAVLTAGDGVGTGKVFHYINGKFDVHQRVYRMSGFGQRASGYFFFLYFSNHFYSRIMQMTAKSSVDSVRREMIARMKIPLPPTMAEQEAIAGALGDADALIDALEQLVAKKRQIKLAAMQELLTGQRRLPGFVSVPADRTAKRETTPIIDVGPYPSDWIVRPLLEVGRWYSGGTPSMKNSAYWNGDVPWVSPKDMKVSRLHDSYDHISDAAVADGARVLPTGAVLMVIRGMILAHSFPVARAERPLAFNQDMKAVVVHDSLDGNFLLYWLIRHAQQIRGLTTESTHGTKRLPPETLYRVPVPFPPSRSEQEAIADVLSNMDSEIDLLDAKLHKARRVKQGMMQELLTGRIRLVSPQPSMQPRAPGNVHEKAQSV